MHTSHAHPGNRTVFTKTIRQPDSLNIYSVNTCNTMMIMELLFIICYPKLGCHSRWQKALKANFSCVPQPLLPGRELENGIYVETVSEPHFSIVIWKVLIVLHNIIGYMDYILDWSSGVHYRIQSMVLLSAIVPCLGAQVSEAGPISTVMLRIPSLL